MENCTQSITKITKDYNYPLQPKAHSNSFLYKIVIQTSVLPPAFKLWEAGIYIHVWRFSPQNKLCKVASPNKHFASSPLYSAMVLL